MYKCPYCVEKPITLASRPKTSFPQMRCTVQWSPSGPNKFWRDCVGSLKKQEQMHDVSYLINICLTISIPVLNLHVIFHKFCYLHDNISHMNENELCWYLRPLLMTAISQRQSKHRKSQGNIFCPLSIANGTSAGCSRARKSGSFNSQQTTHLSMHG